MKLLQLYHSLFQPIVTEWLHCYEVCLLDSSICNKELRSHFLYCLSQSFVCCCELDNRELCDWLIARDLRCRTMNFTLSEELKYPRGFLCSLMPKTKHLDSLSAPICPELIYFINETKITATVLMLTSKSDCDALEAVLKLVGKSIERLNLLDCINLPEDVCVLINRYCPALKTVSLPCVSSVSQCSALKCSFDVMTYRLTNEVVETSGYEFQLRSTTNDDKSVVRMHNMRFVLISVLIHDSDETEPMTDSTADTLIPFLEHLDHACLVQSTPPVLLKHISLHCSVLTQFHANHVAFVDGVLSKILKISTLLADLRLCHCQNVLESDILSVQSNQWLKFFSFQTLDYVSFADAAMAQVYRCFPQLTMVYVSGRADNLKACHNPCVVGEATDVQDLRVFEKHDCYLKIENDSNGHRYVQCSEAFLDYVLDSVLKQNPSMMTISLENVEVTDEDVTAIVLHCPRLTSLFMDTCGALSPQCMYEIAKCKTLKALDIDMEHLSDQMIAALLEDNFDFVRLDLNQSSGFSGSMFLIVGACCPLLLHFCVNNCTAVKSSDVLDLLKGCSRLHYLDLEGCSALDADILPSIKCRRWKYLNIKDCNIDQEAIKENLQEPFFSDDNLEY